MKIVSELNLTNNHFMKYSRRGLMVKGAAIVSSSQCVKSSMANKTSELNAYTPLVISTWSFGETANKEALKVANKGGSLVDAVEKGINHTENDSKNTSVGIGGLPNSDGIVQLDACIMNGPTHGAGSVMALEEIKNPISVARRVMEKTPHVQLAGSGAQKFAISQGFKKENLLTENSHKKWLKWKQQKIDSKVSEDNHDTIALLMIDANQNIAGGCSTSGLAFKKPGRVGDSPIIGSGLYVDNEIGAAGATGIGENILRHCCSFMIVEFMRQGFHPTEACKEVIKRAAKIDPKGFNLDMFFIALNKNGQYGGAGTTKGFQYAVTTKNKSEIINSYSFNNNNNLKEGGNEPTP